jgi:hypothetical protein
MLGAQKEAGISTEKSPVAGDTSLPWWQLIPLSLGWKAGNFVPIDTEVENKPAASPGPLPVEDFTTNTHGYSITCNRVPLRLYTEMELA